MIIHIYIYMSTEYTDAGGGRKRGEVKVFTSFRIKNALHMKGTYIHVFIYTCVYLRNRYYTTDVRRVLAISVRVLVRLGVVGMRLGLRRLALEDSRLSLVGYST